MVMGMYWLLNPLMLFFKAYPRHKQIPSVTKFMYSIKKFKSIIKLPLFL